ncbi:MAG TPA: hypothetical protein VG273_23020 [Bryobacteraceae bacterium]|nr:hypothetical protein [Bryobacteraceae bacterium]
MPGDKISYRPVEIDAMAKKKVRVALLLVPSEGSKIVVFEPRPADEPTSWVVPFRVQLASLVWGPEGLNKAKVTNLVANNDELIAQLADYAAQTQEAQAIIQSITQQQLAQDTGQDLDAAVTGFASRFPAARIDRTQSVSAQLGALIHGVNPSLAAYDPLAQNPQQQAAQTAGLAAAVAGLFFGNSVGLATGGGAVLVNLHSLLFPQTEFLSALGETTENHPKDQEMGLCGSKAAASRIQRAFLWATRIPDVPAPQISFQKTAHLPVGVKASFPIQMKAKEWTVATRAQDWRLVSQDGQKTIPIATKIDTKGKTIELDLTGEKVKPGRWTLAANWDWDPMDIPGQLVLHDISRFNGVHLTPDSQDRLNPRAGTLDLELEGADFEFVRKIEYKKQGDPFAEAQSLLFHLPKEPADGPESSLKIRLNANPLTPGNYVFLIAQNDGRVHDAPFKVLPLPPAISGTPIVLNQGSQDQTVVLHGTGLDQIENVLSDEAQITLGEGGTGEARSATIKISPDAKPGTFISVQLKVKDFEEPVTVEDALSIAGPRPAIAAVRESAPGNPGVALNPGEMASNSLVSFEMTLQNAPEISGVALFCGNSTRGAPPLRVKASDGKDNPRFIQESADSVFLSFRPDSVGRTGCEVMTTVTTPHDGESAPQKLGVVVRLPKIDSFQLTDDKLGDSLYAAVLQGQDLESIVKVGWDAQTGVAVDTIPTPLESPDNKESLRIAIPWPAPAPHAPLFVWLRGENRGRLTSARY